MPETGKVRPGDHMDFLGSAETFLKREFGKHHCFLCGVALTKSNKTQEHVIPAWAIRRYKLLMHRMSLTNGTSIPYSRLTVPSCADCNKTYLKPLEDAMAAATAIGPTAVRDLGEEKIFLWLGKVFYGLLHRDHTLRAERAMAQSEPLMTTDDLSRYEMHCLFLQMVRSRVVCEGFFPASIRVVETQVPDDPALQWDFRDGIDSMFIAVRMGATGLLAVLHDSGVQAEARTELVEHAPSPLHPLQFVELAAMFGYGSTLFTRTPKYMVVEGDPIRVIQLPLGGLSAKPLLAQWEPVTYARHLAFHTEIPMELLYSPPDRVMSWLCSEGPSPRSMPLVDFPWPHGRPVGGSSGE